MAHLCTITNLQFNLPHRDLYLFGESYGGKYIPALSHRIHLAKKDPEHYGGPVDLNLVGLGIGNGWMSPVGPREVRQLPLLPRLAGRGAVHDALEAGGLLNSKGKMINMRACLCTRHAGYIFGLTGVTNLMLGLSSRPRIFMQLVSPLIAMTWLRLWPN